MYSNNTVNFEESTTILNACTKKKKILGNLLKAPRNYDSFDGSVKVSRNTRWDKNVSKLNLYIQQILELKEKSCV